MDMVALNARSEDGGGGGGSAGDNDAAFYSQVMAQISDAGVRASAHAALLLQASVSSQAAVAAAAGVCNQLIVLLDNHIDVATKSLFAAANNAPMYTILFAIRLIVGDVNLERVVTSGSAQDVQAWRRTIANLLDRLGRVASITFDVVSNSSPEGYVPENGGVGENDGDDDGNDGDHGGGTDGAGGDDDGGTNGTDGAAHGSAEGSDGESAGGDHADANPVWVNADGPRGSPAQLILVCCWRSMKEMALVVDALFKSVPLPCGSGKRSGDGGAAGRPELIDAEAVAKLGSTMRQLATDARHRGAVENIAVGFSTIVSRLWRYAGDADLAKLPERWLAEIVGQIQAPAPLSITRRSAGFAQVVLVLLVSAPAASKTTPHPVVEATVTTLVNVARGTAGDGTPGARAHGLNVLRAILRDASIGSSVLHHIADIADLAIAGFEAEEFPIRNSSLMLFSAIVARLFGVKRVRDEHDVSNLLPTNTLFSRYPGLYTVFKQRLNAGLAAKVGGSATLALAPAVYPLLILLGRLTCSAMTGPISCSALEQLRSLVGAHAASPMLLIRRAAARAFAMLCPADKLLDEIKASLAIWSGTRRSANTIHGHQLQTLALLQKSAGCGAALSSAVAASIADHLAGAAPALLLKSGGCPELAVAAGNVFVHVLAASNPWVGPLFERRPDVAETLANLAWANLQRQSPYGHRAGHPSPGLLAFVPGHPGAALCLKQSAAIWAMIDLRATGRETEMLASTTRWDALLCHWDADARLGALRALGDAAAERNPKAGQVIAGVAGCSTVPYDLYPECAVAMARALRLWLEREPLPWTTEVPAGVIVVDDPAAVMKYAAMPTPTAAGGMGGEVTAAELIALRGAVMHACTSAPPALPPLPSAAAEAAPPPAPDQANATDVADLAVLISGCAVDRPAAERLASTKALELVGADIMLGNTADRESAWLVWRTLLPMMQDDDVAVQASAVRTVCAAERKHVRSSLTAHAHGGSSGGGGHSSVCPSRALELGLATLCACWQGDAAVLPELLALAVPTSKCAARIRGALLEAGGGGGGGSGTDGMEGSPKEAHDEANYSRLFELDAATHSSFAEPDLASAAAATALQNVVRGGGHGSINDGASGCLAAEWVRLQNAELPAALEQYAAAKRSLDALAGSGLVASARASLAHAALARASQAVVLLSTTWGCSSSTAGSVDGGGGGGGSNGDSVGGGGGGSGDSVGGGSSTGTALSDGTSSLPGVSVDDAVLAEATAFLASASLSHQFNFNA